MPSTPVDLDNLRVFFDQYISNYLDQYTASITQGDIKFTAKEINDPVWGTVSLSPIEIAILDSPILQRLRRVRQLGVAHWVYPGAIHTRFEHTLGVLAKTQSLVDALNSFPSKSNGTVQIPKDISQTLRLAALLHDIGHGCFSHVSEKALGNFVPFRLVITEFNKKQEVDKAQLSEIAAFNIINSPSFAKLIDALFGKVDGWPQLNNNLEDNKKEVIRAVSNIIIGKKFIDEYPTAQDLISGPFDADKIDYLMRDALYCGVPNVVDTSRLIQKLELKNVPEKDIPKHLYKGLRVGLPGYKLFGIKSSGARVLDELVMARTFLHSKVYRHQKVQAIEAMVETLFRAFGKQLTEMELLKVAYLFSDEEIISMTEENYVRRMKRVGISPSEDPGKAAFASTVGSLTARLRDRRLFVRVLQIGASFPGDPNAESNVQRRNLIRLNNDLKNQQKLSALKDRIVTEINWLATNAPNLFIGKRDLQPEFSIAITPPSSASGNSEIDRALIFGKDGKIDRFGEAAFNSDAWSSAYDYSGAAAGYVFADLPYSLAAYIASEKVLFEMYEIVVPSSSLNVSKVSAVAIEGAKKQLASMGYYRKLPIEMRPTPDKLNHLDARSVIDSFCSRLAIYQGPTEFSGDHVIDGDMRTKVINWLKQFEREEFVDLALQMLSKFRVLSRKEVVQAALNFFKEHPGFKGSHICGFGSLKDSSAIMSYFANDLPQGLHSGVYAVEDAQRKKEDVPVVFFDDIIASGGQATDLLSGWFGDKKGRRDLGEERLPLHEDTVKYLKSRKVAFLFVAGWNKGMKVLADRCEELGLDATIYADILESEIPFAFENCDLKAEEGIVDEFKQFCQERGRWLLTSNNHKREKIDSRSLGYGNRAMLLALPYNVPTKTLTCIRERGVSGDETWHEIFMRRPKK